MWKRDISRTDGVGFEPTVRYKRTHTFQACALNHSATRPTFLRCNSLRLCCRGVFLLYYPLLLPVAGGYELAERDTLRLLVWLKVHCNQCLLALPAT